MSDPIIKWLEDFQAAVRTKDYAAGLALHDQATVFFGTRLIASESLSEYSTKQWRGIWEKSRDFTFNEIYMSKLGHDLGFAATIWSNVTEIEGKEQFREGRATFVFRILENSPLCIHSHFSEFPNHH